MAKGSASHFSTCMRCGILTSSIPLRWVGRSSHELEARKLLVIPKGAQTPRPACHRPAPSWGTLHSGHPCSFVRCPVVFTGADVSRPCTVVSFQFHAYLGERKAVRKGAVSLKRWNGDKSCPRKNAELRAPFSITHNCEALQREMQEPSRLLLAYCLQVLL